jgi:hypothetical protein
MIERYGVDGMDEGRLISVVVDEDGEQSSCCGTALAGNDASDFGGGLFVTRSKKQRPLAPPELPLQLRFPSRLKQTPCQKNLPTSTLTSYFLV